MSSFTFGEYSCRFFASLSALEQFTRSLNSRSSDNACQHCQQNDQWHSHGYVYKQEAINQRTTVGKRIVCSNRGGKGGCGHTRQLYLSDVIPHKHARLAVVRAFILALIQGRSIPQAYHDAVGRVECDPRQAWRWLQSLYQQLGHWRTGLSLRGETPIDPQRRSPRLNILLATLQMILPTINTLQQTRQRAFF